MNIELFLTNDKSFEFDSEIANAKKMVDNLYFTYMDKISYGRYIDYNANKLIGLSMELEGLRYLINNKIKNIK
ncbi:MAG: hypothetical protein ACI4HK_08500 [Ruminococcus sp.]